MSTPATRVPAKVAYAKRTNAFAAELLFIEVEKRQLLDDNLTNFLSHVRSKNLFDDDEWVPKKWYAAQAKDFLARYESRVPPATDRKVTLIVDADPRNADWLRSARVCLLAHRSLPVLAALWLWSLKSDILLSFWNKVGRVGEQLIYPQYAMDLSDHDSGGNQ